MSERMSEVPSILEQLYQEEAEGEEPIRQPAEEEIISLYPDMMLEDKSGSRDRDEVSKTKQTRVQSVFCLVRNQIKAQPVNSGRNLGMLQLVEHVTKELERCKTKEKEDRGDTDAVLDEEKVVETQPSPTEDLKVLEEPQEAECVVLLQEVLDTVKALRTEVREELTTLKQESRSHTEEALRGLETRLTTSLSVNANGHVNAKKPLTIRPLPDVPGRRILRRTQTTMAPKNATPLAFRPRCMSDPVVVQTGTKARVTNSNGIIRTSKKEDEKLKGPLFPALPSSQDSRKPLRSKARPAKMA